MGLLILLVLWIWRSESPPTPEPPCAYTGSHHVFAQPYSRGCLMCDYRE